MFHLQPVSEEKASAQVRTVYIEIEQTLTVTIAPLVFQYIANYENYFLFLWQQIKANVVTSSFQAAHTETIRFAKQATSRIYTPSPVMADFITTISPLERQQIMDTISLLERINATLLLLTIGIRESLKGINIGQQHIAEYTAQAVNEPSSFFTDPSNIYSSSRERTEINNTVSLLSPVFGSQAIQISQYPQFFSYIAMEIEALVMSEDYLRERVFLEQKTIQFAGTFTHPLGCSYTQLLNMIKGQPYFDELLYILVDTFPSQFPKLVFTTAVMRRVVEPNNTSEVTI